ncbi:MAG TPA: methyltransferase domain-containing protein [Chryseosolibacter sp.]|nr:methyltransferase domain-containing protein [Chryseosolibacter sp.]
MRLHRGTSEAVIQSLRLIFEENRYADKVIEKVLKQNSRWGARDRRFIAETTYDIVRWYRWFRELGQAKGTDFWKLLAVWCVLSGVDLPAWEEFEDISAEEVLDREKRDTYSRKTRESIPDWLDELGEKELGTARWQKELSALNEIAPDVLRTNTLKITKENLRATLREDEIDTIALPDYPDALVLAERQNIFGSPAFKDGLFEVQDAGSQAISPFLRITPGLRVIDACAGAGGKTLHLAALMQNKGRIIAMDTEQWKLDELQKRARRAGVSNMEARVIESGKTIKRLANSADRLLLDVPCSGLGVLKRNPDAKWKLSLDFIDKIRALQQHILRDYCDMLKPGGLMVYSTCSILPSENEGQVRQFLDHNQSFELIEQKHIFPSEGFDGFYMALLRKKGA